MIRKTLRQPEQHLAAPRSEAAICVCGPSVSVLVVSAALIGAFASISPLTQATRGEAANWGVAPAGFLTPVARSADWAALDDPASPARSEMRDAVLR